MFSLEELIGAIMETFIRGQITSDCVVIAYLKYRGDEGSRVYQMSSENFQLVVSVSYASASSLERLMEFDCRRWQSQERKKRLKQVNLGELSTPLHIGDLLPFKS